MDIRMFFRKTSMSRALSRASLLDDMRRKKESLGVSRAINFHERRKCTRKQFLTNGIDKNSCHFQLDVIDEWISLFLNFPVVVRFVPSSSLFSPMSINSFGSNDYSWSTLTVNEMLNLNHSFKSWMRRS